MAKTLQNPYRGTGLRGLTRFPQTDATPVGTLLAHCPAHKPTPLRRADALARDLRVASVALKDERGRMGLGSFKALGAAYAIARDASLAGGAWDSALAGRCYVTASAGNHGLSVAAGARLFGARAVVYLAQTVPEAFADRLRAKGAEVCREGDTYEASMAAAEAAATGNGWTLLSDSSWPGYEEMPFHVMEGYLQMAAEIVAEMAAPPTHILLQAGVGGLAAAVAAHARQAWGDAPVIVVVEPDAAAALQDSIAAGAIVTAQGPVSDMGRLDCKTPSMIALAGLARDADVFVTISEADAADAVATLAANGIPTTPSGAAGLAAALSHAVPLPEDARLLAIISEGAEDG